MHQIVISLLVVVIITSSNAGDCECGRYLSSSSNSRIFGAQNTTSKGRYPWQIMVEMEWKKPKKDNDTDTERLTATCTGVLISRRHVLTSAHCLDATDIDESYT